MFRRTTTITSSSSAAAAAATTTTKRRVVVKRRTTSLKPGNNKSNNKNTGGGSFQLQRLSPAQLSQQQPFSWLFFSTVERGCSPEGVRLLSAHPDCPAPSKLFSELAQHCQPPVLSVMVLLHRASQYGEKALLQKHSEQQQQVLAKSGQQQQQQQQQQDLEDEAVLDIINNVLQSSNQTTNSSSSSSSSSAVDISTPGASSKYVKTQRSLEILHLWEQVQQFPVLTADATLLETFCKLFLASGLMSQASDVLRMIPNHQLDFTMWNNLLLACASGKLRDTDLLWRLVMLPQEFLEKLLVPASLMRKEKRNSRFGFLDATSTGENAPAAALLSSSSTNQLAIFDNNNNNSSNNNLPQHYYFLPSDFPLSLQICSHLLALQGGRGIPVLAATHIILRYLDTTTTTSRNQNNKTPPTTATEICHPLPILTYFNLITQQRSAGRHNVHWLVPWRIFQQLNTSNPTWFKNRNYASAEEAENVIRSLIEILASGAPPILAFNLARIASGYGIVDGVDIALHLMNRFHVAFQQASSATSQNQNQMSRHRQQQQQTQKSEIEKIVAKVYSWLTDVVQIHKRQSRHNAVVLTARVLIRFGMTNEISDLYSKVLDQASDVDPKTRTRLLHVMEDLVCPHCCSILSKFNVHQDRTCDYCLELVPAKPVTERSSFELTQGYLKRVREKRKQREKAKAEQMAQSLKRAEAHAVRAQEEARAAALRSRSSGALFPPEDPAKKLIDEVISPLVDGVSTKTAQGFDVKVSLPPESLDAADIMSMSMLNTANSDQQQSSVSDLFSSNTTTASLWDSEAKLALGKASSLFSKDVTVPRGISTEDQQQQKQQKMESNISVSSNDMISTAVALQKKVASSKAPAPWVCLWCNELNPAPINHEQPVRTCCACGADTGPYAPWRFNFSSQRKQQQQQQTDKQDGGKQQQTQEEQDMDFLLDEVQQQQEKIVSSSNNRHAAKMEIKQKIKHALSTKNLDDMVAAAYFLLLYRKMFLLSASAARGDFVLVQTLIELLIDAHEKTLAACLFMRTLPASIRTAIVSSNQEFGDETATTTGEAGIEQQEQEESSSSIEMNELATKLASLFSAQGSAPPNIFRDSQTANQMRRDDRYFFSAVFGPQTCEHCFGVHPSHECSIVTRDFHHYYSPSAAARSKDKEQQYSGASASETKTLRTSKNEKLHLSISSIAQAVDNLKAATAAETGSGKTSQQQQQQQQVSNLEPKVISAYHRFVISPNRELFATTCHEQANSLALHLCRVGFPKRAAFVTCHIPLEYRSNEALTELAGWFDLSPDDIATLLRHRVIGDATKSKHPNVIQLTRYCCVCFNGQHASHNCPRMIEWFHDAIGKEIHGGVDSSSSSGEETSTTTTSSKKRVSVKKDSASRCLQVNGWTGSGPERLYALYRFLLARIDDISELKQRKEPQEITHALNATIRRLVETNQKSAAWRLFSRTNPSSLKRETIAKVLVMNGVEEMLVEEMSRDTTIGSDWLQLAVPPTKCLVCFEDHSFQVCPELTTKSTVEGILHVLTHVGKHRCAPQRGAAAAAEYVQHLYVSGAITTETFYRHTTLGTLMSSLAQRCFNYGMTVQGFQLMRRLPYSAITPTLVTSFWKSAGLEEKIIYQELQPKLVHYLSKAIKAVQVREELNLKAQSDVSVLDSPEFSAAQRALSDATKEYHTFVEAPVCRHCFTAGHGIVECELILHESEFGRDLLSIFRVLMADSRFSPEEGKKLLIHLVQYLVHHHRHLPYHVIGVSRTMNSLAVLMSMLQMPGLGLRLLLSIPAAYRQRHVYEHLLQAFGLNANETQRRCQQFLQDCIDASDGFAMTIPDSLLFVCPSRHDIALSHVFAGISRVPSALTEADKLLAEDSNDIVDKRSGEVVLTSCYDPKRPPQTVGISALKEAIDPLQRFVEERIEMQIGSRHELFTKVVELVQESSSSGHHNE